MKIAFYGDSLTEGKAGIPYVDKIEKKFPAHNIINFGKGGDTVIGLYNRITKRNLDISSDIAFIWIGSNDVFVKVSWLYYPLKIVTNQRPSNNHDELVFYYKKIIEVLSKKAKKIVCVPPILIGENLKNKWNQEVKEISEYIEKITVSYINVEYFDLRKVFIEKLERKKPSNYLIKSNLSLLFDYMYCNSPEKIKEVSNKRGLFFTLDGVHLNKKGAEIVSEEFIKYLSKNQR